MKYVRTKYGIYTDDYLHMIVNQEKPFKFDDGDYSKTGDSFIIVNNHYYKVLEQADTIEELCDEFVITDWKEKEKPVLCKYQKDKNALYYMDEHGLNILYIPNLLSSNCKIRGAIWTNKGLIYVAQMKNILPNGEIDWRLL